MDRTTHGHGIICQLLVPGIKFDDAGRESAQPDVDGTTHGTFCQLPGIKFDNAGTEVVSQLKELYRDRHKFPFIFPLHNLKRIRKSHPHNPEYSLTDSTFPSRTCSRTCKKCSSSVGGIIRCVESSGAYKICVRAPPGLASQSSPFSSYSGSSYPRPHQKNPILRSSSARIKPFHPTGATLSKYKSPLGTQRLLLRVGGVRLEMVQSQDSQRRYRILI